MIKLIVNGIDISQFVVNNLNSSGGKTQSSRKLEFGVVVSGTDKNLPKLSIMMADDVTLLKDNKTIFKGKVYDKNKTTMGNVMQVVAFDDLLILNNSEIIEKFEDTPPSGIAQKIISNFGLQVGSLASGSNITRTFDMVTAYNAIHTAYKIENEKSGKPFIIRMADGKVNVEEQGKTVAKFELKGDSNLLDAEYSENIEEAVSQVKIIDKNGKEAGEVSGDFLKGATKIYHEEENEDKQARAKGILQGIKRMANVKVYRNDDMDLITGNAVMIKEPFTGLIGKFYIESDSHRWENGHHFVDLNLEYENIMADIDTSVPEDKQGSNKLLDFSSGAGGGSLGSNAIKAGESIKGTKYKWGGTNPSTGVDCSGFTQWSLQKAGANIPGRLTSASLRNNPKQYNMVEVSMSDLKPGDVLWQQGHVAMYHSAGKIIESGGVSKNILGYSGVAVSNMQGRRFAKAYRYVG